MIVHSFPNVRVCTHTLCEGRTHRLHASINKHTQRSDHAFLEQTAEQFEVYLLGLVSVVERRL